jgi:HlyD family secretion protein
VSNVVTYSAIVDAPNPTLELKPGMTATLAVEVARRDNVLRVPVAALRFKPASEIVAHYVGPQSPVAPAVGKGVWVVNGAAIAPVAVTTGISDATQTEITGTSVAEGELVVTRSAPAGSGTATSSATNNPLLPSRPGFGRR